MTSANSSKDQPTSMKRKLSPVEDDKPAKRPAKISSRLAYLLEYYKTHPNAHSPFRVQILERVAREKDEKLEKEKTMAESAKIKVSTSIPRPKLLRANSCSKSPRSRLESKPTSRLRPKTRFLDLRTMLRSSRSKRLWLMRVVSRTSRRRSIMPLLPKLRPTRTKTRSSRSQRRMPSPELDQLREVDKGWGFQRSNVRYEQMRSNRELEAVLEESNGITNKEPTQILP